MKKFLLISLICLQLTPKAEACLCGSHYSNLNTAAGPVITIPAHTLDQNKATVGFGLNFTNYGEFSNSKLNALNSNDIHGHSLDTAMLLNTSLSYGLTDDLTLTTIIPFYFAYDLKATEEGSTVNDGDSIGFGDISLLAKYRFLNSKKHKFAIAALAGIKMPTGDTNQKNQAGFLLGADDQPGSGSWDPIMGLALSKTLGKINLDSNVLYILSTKGKQDTAVGDKVFFNFGANRFIEKLSSHNLKTSLAFEINGLWQEKSETLGVSDPNHGGLVIFLTPGLKLNFQDHLFANFYVGLPTIQELNGVQSDLNLQLGFNLNYLLGLGD